MRRTQIIGVRTAAEDEDPTAVEWHIASIGGGPDYVTACGLDGDDPEAEQYGTVEAPRGTRVGCQQCFSLWAGFKELTLRASSFTEEAKS